MSTIAEHLASRRLNWAIVAKKSGISQERLIQVAGGANASLAEIRQIASALRLPLSSILIDAPAEPIRFLFRQTLDQRQTSVDSSLEVLSGQIRDALSIAKRLPKNTLWLDLFHDLDATPQTAEGFASLFRKAYGGLDDSQPYLHLGRTIEEIGVFLLYCRDSKVEGASAIVEQYAFVLIGARTFKPRMSFHCCS